MKNKKLFNGMLSLIFFAIVGVFTWFLVEFIPTFKTDYKTLYVIAFVLIDLVFFIFAFISAYKMFAKENRFAVSKGINTALGTILLIAGVLAIACGVIALVHYYKQDSTNNKVLISSILITLAGLIVFLFSLVIYRRNTSIKETEKRLEQFNKEPEKPETFNDKKVNKTCKFCGCRLTKDALVCPNCQSKID